MDNNLELAIVEQLLRAGTVAFDRAAFLVAHPPEKEAEDEDQEAHLYRKNYDIEYALRALLEPTHLPTIQHVWWEGGMETQHLIWNYWDGEDDAFDIESLDGLEACTSLVSLSIQNAVRDLSPLASIVTLESVRVGGGRAQLIEDVSPLVGLSRLKRLDLSHNPTLRDVACLATVHSLEELDLSWCAVEDFSFALQLPRLRKLAVTRAQGAQTATFATLRGRGVAVSSAA